MRLLKFLPILALLACVPAANVAADITSRTLTVDVDGSSTVQIVDDVAGTWDLYCEAGVTDCQILYAASRHADAWLNQLTATTFELAVPADDCTDAETNRAAFALAWNLPTSLLDSGGCTAYPIAQNKGWQIGIWDKEVYETE